MVATIGEILPEAARRFGERTSLVIEDETFSFSELEALSNSVANGLVSVGVQPGDRVTLYGPNCWEWIVAYYAAVKTGAVVNPISSMLTVEEVRYVVKDSGGRVLLTSAEMGVPLLELVGTENLSHVVLWGDEVPVGATSFMEWANEADRTFAPVLRGPADLLGQGVHPQQVEPVAQGHERGERPQRRHRQEQGEHLDPQA